MDATSSYHRLTTCEFVLLPAYKSNQLIAPRAKISNPPITRIRTRSPRPAPISHRADHRTPHANTH